MTVHLADKYSSKMDLAFAHGSYTDKFVNSDYDFDGVIYYRFNVSYY